MSIILPAMVLLADHGGDIDSYEQVIHDVYLDIFQNPQIFFNGKRIVPIVYPIQHRGRHWTFSHMTSTGPDENDREYDLRRCERISWVKAILQNINNPVLKKWRQTRKSRNRIAIWHEQENFLIVLEETTNSYKLITTFNTFANKYKMQYKREYEQFIEDVKNLKAVPL